MTRTDSRNTSRSITLTFVLALVQFVWLVWYFYTGFGGSQELVAHVMSIALTLQILFMYQQDYLYKWLPPIANHLIVAIYHRHLRLSPSSISMIEFERIAIYSQGSYTQQRLHRRPAGVPAGDGAVAARPSDPVLDQCHSWSSTRCGATSARSISSGIPARRFYRVVTSSTVEFSTGIYGIYGQLALTLIAAFLLLAGAANGFGAQRAMIKVMRRHRRPLAAVGAADGGARLDRDRHGQRQRLGQRRRGRHHHHPADEALRRAGHLRRRGRDRGLDGRPDHAADDGRRRLPDVGISRRALLGGRDARLCAGLRLLRLDRLRRLSAVRAAVAARSRSAAEGAALRPGQDRDLFLSVAFLALPDGLGRQGELLAALYTAVFMLALLVALSCTSSTSSRTRRWRRRRCSAASAAPSRRMPT